MNFGRDVLGTEKVPARAGVFNKRTDPSTGQTQVEFHFEDIDGNMIVSGSVVKKNTGTDISGMMNAGGRGALSHQILPVAGILDEVG